MSGSGDFSIGSKVWPGTSKVIEEMGELAQVLGKLIALAGDVDHWDGTNLADRCVEETSDLLGALQFWSAENLTTRQRIDQSQRAEAKRLLFEQWQHNQSGDAGAQRSTSATVGHEIAASGTGEDAP